MPWDGLRCVTVVFPDHTHFRICSMKAFVVIKFKQFRIFEILWDLLDILAYVVKEIYF